jgi:uncharacterized protein (TIGR02646 family)
MRPVERGTTDGIFLEYQEAKLLLTTRLGHYCSFCERHMPAGLAVEHMQPKKPFPALELVWENFLLACVNCNSCKGTKNKSETLDAYFWVDRDNTSRAFIYSKGGLISVNPLLETHLQAKATKTLKFLGLEKLSWEDPKAKDNRQAQRHDTWNQAEMFRGDLLEEDTLKRREYIVIYARKTGFWSVWMTVFKDDPDMLERFIKAFPGTADCFHPATFQPVPRVNGAI